jgi:hypothetical protein
MNGSDRPPDLDALSDKEKDALIHTLWEDLQCARALVRRIEQPLLEIPTASAEASGLTLFAQLRDVKPTKRARASATPNAQRRLGGGLGFLLSRRVIGAVLVSALLIGLDYGLDRYQQFRLEQKRLAELRL